jgi:type II secretory pathway pseudopilin PulG
MIVIVVLIVAATVVAFSAGVTLGINIGVSDERERTGRTRRMIEESRRNHPTGK